MELLDPTVAKPHELVGLSDERYLEHDAIFVSTLEPTADKPFMPYISSQQRTEAEPSANVTDTANDSI